MRRNRDFIGPAGMGGMVSLWGASSLINNIQSGTVTCVDNGTSGTATITSVDLSNSVLMWGQYSSTMSAAGGIANYNPSAFLCGITLTNATTVTLSKQGGAGSGSELMSAPFEVVEFKPGVLRSVQRGLITISGGATSQTATVTAVNTAKAFRVGLGFTAGVSQSDTISGTFSQVVVTNATTVTASRVAAPGAGATSVVPYQVMEFF